MCGAKGWRFRLERKLCWFESNHTDQFLTYTVVFLIYINVNNGCVKLYGVGAYEAQAIDCQSIDSRCKSDAPRQNFNGVVA